ncbi:MAG: hypothetical protein J6T01_05140 [Kiritimatiellae bacterium]|nr:hypothetical protein [Kiritimatiellia bacterium]
MSEDNGGILDLASFDFSPDWAKKDAGVNIGGIRPEKDSGDDRRRTDRSQASGDRGERGGRERFGERRRFGDRRRFDDGEPRGDRRRDGDRRRSGGDRGQPAERNRFEYRGAAGGGGQPEERDGRRLDGFNRRERFPGRPRPLDAEVKILPESKALGTIIRKLQNDIHAYKLKDLAYFFLDNPSLVLLKITPKGADGAAPEKFRQCKVCGYASLSDEDVLEHAVFAHLGDYYDSKEVDCEPPKGNFNCVAKCGLSGVLLGPPNIHEFNAVVKEMVRTKYPDMSEEQYRSHIEMVRDADAIEEWRRGATRKTMFFAKGRADVEGEPGFSRESVEGEFKRTIAPSLVDSPKHLLITAEAALKSPVQSLRRTAELTLEEARRNPFEMCFALRGAFHHRKLKFFRVNEPRGQEFVTNVEYREFDSAHAIPELAAAAKFVGENPCCDRSEFPQVADFEKHLSWLVSTGHVVAFTNGVYSLAEKYPKYGPQWRKRGKKQKAEAEPPAAPEAPAAEAKTEAAPPPAPEAPAAATPGKIEEKNDETAPVVAE